MSPLVDNEQSVKRPSDWLKYEAENTLMLLSNVYIVKSHYVKAEGRSVACMGDTCKICQDGKNKPTSEYYYVVLLNGQKGILNVKATPFFDMNKIEKIKKKDKRHFTWLVYKEGDGMDTKYTTSKDDEIPEDQMTSKTELRKNNDHLTDVVSAHEKNLVERYNEMFGLAPVKTEGDTVAVTPEENVDPDTIPF